MVLRFLRNDDSRQSPAAAKLFAHAKAGKSQLVISDVTVAEVFYVLAKVYKHSRMEVAALLMPLIHSDILEVDNRRRIIDTLQRVAKANVDFGDCYLAATAAEHGDKIASFDSDLQTFPDVVSIVPQ
ncbi:MAG: PIN domain-containing protein [Opitutae bacterium]